MKNVPVSVQRSRSVAAADFFLSQYFHLPLLLCRRTGRFRALSSTSTPAGRPFWLVLINSRHVSPDLPLCSFLAGRNHVDSLMMENNSYRTIWISDLHLGSTQCQADVLLDFLRHNDSEKLYLVGDIIDFWALSKKMYWPRDHNTVIQKVLRKARHGTQIIYVPGNHDENVRDYHNYVFGDIVVKNSDVHTTSAGKRFLVVHGDEYDTIAKYHQWIAKLGSVGYDFLLDVNRLLRAVRRLFDIQSNFSLASFIKFKVKNIVQFISDYEESIVTTLRNEGLDGVICGHIHHAEIKEIDGFLYVNTGDFVESCTAIVEHVNGTLELIKWHKAKAPTAEHHESLDAGIQSNLDKEQSKQPYVTGTSVFRDSLEETPLYEQRTTNIMGFFHDSQTKTN